LINEIAFPGGGAVNKSGLIDAVSKTTSLPKRDAEYAVNALVHIVSGEVRAGRRVVISGFGSFNPTHRGARMGRNPQTGDPVRVAASHGVRFAASGALKDVLNRKVSLAVPATAVSAKKGTAKSSVKQVVRSGTGSAERSAKASTTRGASRSPRGGSRQVVGRTSARRTARAPARKAARISARKAAGRPPARTATKRSAKKAVRRA
jgi:DNA-binding protein HU-beta